jgi:hypothetical protein
MLPMRWRPDAFTGLHDYAAFEPQRPAPGSASIALAQRFWQGLATHAEVSPALRAVAKQMSLRTA